MGGAGLAEPIVSMSEAQAFLRIETGEEEALLVGLIRTASAVCESFINQVVIARDFVADLPASSAWERLSVAPVRSIARVEAVGGDGLAVAMLPGEYAVDIDANGTGWVRLTCVSARRVRVSGSAGMAAEQNGVPEPIRHGVLRLVGHLFAARDGSDRAPPAAVTALWRSYRRARLA
jgi:uncharacterized phiE125 gp8 family phage protein